MSTKIVNAENPEEILWAPDDFGTYSMDKIELITKILHELFENTKVKTEADISEESLANIYTRTQADAAFVAKGDLFDLSKKYAQEEIALQLAAETILGEAAKKVLMGYINTLYKSCYGKDTEDHEASEIGFSTRIDSNKQQIDSNYSLIRTHVLNLMYPISGSGDYDYTKPLVLTESSLTPVNNKIGNLEDIEEGVTNTSLVDAVNYLNDTIKTLAGDEGVILDLRILKANIGTIANLETSAHNLTDAVNEVRKIVVENVGDVSGLKTEDKTLVGGINEVKKNSDDNKTSIGDITKLKAGATNLTDAVNEIKTEADNIGNLEDLDGSLESINKENLVKALNSVISYAKGLESRIKALEGK